MSTREIVQKIFPKTVEETWILLFVFTKPSVSERFYHAMTAANKRTSFGFACLLLFLSGCSFYHEKNPPDASSVVAGTVTWGQVYGEVFQPRCDLCHSAGGAGFDSSNYQAVVTMITQVQDRAITRKSMPADSPLTPYETAVLQDWINEGTPY